MRTFADDTAALIPSWQRHSKQLHKIMPTYSNITTMDINLVKTIAIPFGDQPPDAYTNDLPQYTWATEGRYLGFMIGPTAIESSWKRPIERYQQKLTEWPWSKLGLNLAIRIYKFLVSRHSSSWPSSPTPRSRPFKPRKRLRPNWPPAPVNGARCKSCTI